MRRLFASDHLAPRRAMIPRNDGPAPLAAPETVEDRIRWLETVQGGMKARADQQEQRHRALAHLLVETTATLVELARIVGEQGRRITALEKAQQTAQEEFEDGMEVLRECDHDSVPLRAKCWVCGEIVGPEPGLVDQCPVHGTIRLAGRCTMCEPSIASLRAGYDPKNPPIKVLRQTETARSA